jgi:hypothetical protein
MSDSEDSQLDSAYKKLVESSSSSTTGGADIKKNKAFTTTIVKWPHITQIKVNAADGTKITTHPFLSDDNVFDKLVITHLVVDELFPAAYGAVAQAWKTCAANINKELELGSTNSTKPLCFPAINAKTIKTRFDAYMKFAGDKKRRFHLTVVVMMKRNHARFSLLLKKSMKSTTRSWKPKTVTSRLLPPSRKKRRLLLKLFDVPPWE